MIPIPFGRVIQLGSVGRDTQGVKRALARAEFGKLGKLLPVFGLSAVQNLRGFQRKYGLVIDGVYGPLSHKRLSPFFDDYAFLLYTGKPPRPPQSYLVLPATFIPTHETAGLEGYPAIDCFGAPGTVVLAPANGTVRRLSGHDPKDGGVPGGAYGWSVYVKEAHADRFITHFAERFVVEGQFVKQGEALGTVCDAKVAHMASSLSHVHMGLHAL